MIHNIPPPPKKETILQAPVGLHIVYCNCLFTATCRRWVLTHQDLNFIIQINFLCCTSNTPSQISRLVTILLTVLKKKKNIKLMAREFCRPLCLCGLPCHFLKQPTTFAKRGTDLVASFDLQPNRTLEHHTFIYLLSCNLFRSFYSTIVRHKHKYIIRKVYYGLRARVEK